MDIVRGSFLGHHYVLLLLLLLFFFCLIYLFSFCLFIHSLFSIRCDEENILKKFPNRNIKTAVFFTFTFLHLRLIAPGTRQHNAEANQEQVDEPTRAVQVVHA